MKKPRGPASPPNSEYNKLSEIITDRTIKSREIVEFGGGCKFPRCKPKEIMSIIRNRHNAKKNYVILDKPTLWDEKISLKALGLWARCISRPDNWKFCIQELITKCVEGRDAVYGGINDLIKAKLCIRVQYYLTIRKDGKVYPGAGPVEYIFLEVPATDQEIEEIVRELRDEYERELKDAGLEFYKPISPRESKKNYKLPGNKDPLSKDPLNPHLTRTNVTNAEEGTRTNTGGCSNPKDFMTKDTLASYGIDEKKFNLLKRAFSLDQIAEAFELLKRSDHHIPNPYGWMKKCMEEDWISKDKKREESAKSLISENMDFCLKIEKMSFGKLLPGSSINISKDSLIVICGEKINEIKYVDKNFKDKVSKLLKRMNINV